MSLVRKLLPALALVGVLVAAPTAASADHGDYQFQWLSNSHTLARVPGSFAVLSRSDSADSFYVHARSLVPGSISAIVLAYNNPSACSGFYATPGFPGVCGGPPPSPANCALAAPGHPFDSCNPATGFQVISLSGGTANAGGVDNTLLSVTGVTNPEGAELQLYLSPLLQSDGTTKKAFAFFAAPSESD